VASVSHPAPIHRGLDVHRDTISVAILPLTSKPPWSTGFPTTSRRCAGSLAASAIPAGCEPATRPARSALSSPGLLEGMGVGCVL
jgi:hypothetical protein